MSSRCASCSYPLSISDSVRCYECDSYFHIDCAQLVGFPCYELSDSSRNTFHCRTCELLPLPCDSDTDSDLDECAMPSRQLDYNLETQGDFTKDMNEVKGSIQDLSNLCKDMFREINEIKSINLTLRCCVENLKHDNEERDNIIASLKRRLDALEGKSNFDKASPFLSLDFPNDDLKLVKVTDNKDCRPVDDKISESNVETHRENSSLGNLISIAKSQMPRLEFCKPQIIEENIQSWTWKGETAEKINQEEDESIEEGETDESDLGEESQDWEVLNEETESVSKQRVEDEIKRSDDKNISESVPQEEEERMRSTPNLYESCDKEEEAQDFKQSTGRKDEHELEEETDAETESVRTLKEFEQGESEQEISSKELETLTNEEVCELLDDESLKEEMTVFEDKIMPEVEYNTESQPNTESSHDQILNKCEKEQVEDVDNISSVDFKPDSASFDEEFKKSEGKTDQMLQEIRHEDLVEVDVGEIPEEVENEDSAFTEEIRHDDIDHNEVFEVEDEHLDKSENKPLEEGETCPESVECPAEESRLEGEERLVEEPTLEGEQRLDGELEPQPVLDGEAGAESEGELRLGGQSQLDGEVQPSETSSQTLPLHHTEEDLWHYLKEAVSGEHHPSTVEEFLQSLIGTLQHVPEEYLQPVVEANIKRANSPCSTDGDHLGAVSEAPVDKQAEDSECAAATESDSTPSLVPEGTPPVEEDSPQFQEEINPGDSEGASAVEAAA